MRDQTPLRAAHVGVAAFADLDLRDYVPDQLEIDFGNADAAVLAGARNRQGHVRFGLAAEIDRAVVDLVSHSLGKLRLLGEIGTAVHPVHREPRYPEPLLAGG